MALAQAQHKVKQLADALEERGAEVDYAIHPAGRMPGHERASGRSQWITSICWKWTRSIPCSRTRTAIIVGANDGPTRRLTLKAPTLHAHSGKRTRPRPIICNYDEKPGYAGVDNPLYTKPGVIMMLGDAAQTVGNLVKLASGAAPAASAEAAPEKAEAQDATQALKTAKNVIIVPGYGMALAQAQHKVKQLADVLEERGATVNYAIHPVAGRMPGHMNVLLAEANVDYEHLLEMDTVNPMFADADLVIIVGANDVVNPAANTAEGTPIYGMPILEADRAKAVIICNYDEKPGYAGVDNPLYTKPGVTCCCETPGQPDKLPGHGAGLLNRINGGAADAARPRGWHGCNGVIKHVPSFTNFSAKPKER